MNLMAQTPIKVFISYSHDSPEHKKRVNNLFRRLRSDRIDCEIDQHEIVPSEDWQEWMEKQIVKSDILYREYGENDKFIPVVFRYDDKEFIPYILSTGNFYNVSLNTGYQELTNHIKSINPTPRPDLPKTIAPFNVPLHRNAYFTGREDILTKLSESKQTNRTHASFSQNWRRWENSNRRRIRTSL